VNVNVTSSAPPPLQFDDLDAAGDGDDDGGDGRQ
jgi:hypothetical protein